MDQVFAHAAWRDANLGLLGKMHLAAADPRSRFKQEPYSQLCLTLAAHVESHAVNIILAGSNKVAERIGQEPERG